MKHLGTKTIETERLILRRFVPEDAQAMYDNWASDPEVTKYLTWPTYTSVEPARQIIGAWCAAYEHEDFYQWAIVLKTNGEEPIGSISVVDKDDKIMKAEIGYCLSRRFWHKGIMSEALRAVIGFLIEEVGMNRVESRHDTNNPNSGAVMKKCGMKFEGTLRQADWNNQGICDAVHYAILACEWQN